MRVSNFRVSNGSLPLNSGLSPLTKGSFLLPKAKMLKYLRILYTIHGNAEREMDRWFCGAYQQYCRLCTWIVVMKRELSWKLKIAIYQSIYVSTLTNGHELWVATKRSVNGFKSPKWVSSVGWLDSALGLGWRILICGAWTRAAALLCQEVGAAPTKRRPWGKPRIRWKEYLTHLYLSVQKLI